jgi:hypothetical protein
MGMIEEGTRRELDFSALKGAIEGKDPDALLAFYAEDAQLRVENAAHPEGKAFELEGGEHLVRRGVALPGRGRGFGPDDARGRGRADSAPDRLGEACP